jgi:hypothetical protein
MPWVPEGYTGHGSFLFVASSIISNFRHRMEWPAVRQFDGAAWHGGDYAGVVIPCLRVRGSGTVNTADRLLTPQGGVPAENAYVSSRKAGNYVGDNRICGKLWNCCVLGMNYPVSVVFAKMLDGEWVHVSSNAWAKDYAALPGRGVLYGAEAASVWWKVESREAS